MNLAYRTWGVRGSPPLVLLHGFLGSSSDWETLADNLQSHFYLIAIDLPGHGKSLSVNLKEKRRGFVDSVGYLINDVLDQLDVKRFGLLGYSLGARIAMGFALEHERKISHLILESGHSGLASEEEKKARWQSDQAWKERFLTKPIEQVLKEWYQQPVFSDIPDSCREVLIEKRTFQNVSLLAEVFELFSLSKQPDYSQVMAKADFPVHYLYGENDKKYKALALSLSERGCLTTVNGVSQAGHNIHWQQPEAMAAVIQTLYGMNGADYE